MDDCNQWAVVIGFLSRWRLVMSVVEQESVLGPMLFNMFINNLNSGMELIPGKYADDTKLIDTSDMTEGRDAIQMHLDGLEE